VFRGCGINRLKNGNCSISKLKGCEKLVSKVQGKEKFIVKNSRHDLPPFLERSPELVLKIKEYICEHLSELSSEITGL
jgi:hypothetical protein